MLDDATMRDRFVVCRNPDEADRDATVRAQIVERLEAAIEGSDQLSERKRAELAGALKTRPAYNRFLRVTPKTGLLRIDRAAITADAKLDGKFLLRTSDPTLSVKDIAVGYKQLLQVERGWRDLKLHLDLRPVFHRREDRIRAHVLLCWLALLLARIAENACGNTWRNLRRELHQLAAIESVGTAGRLIETTEPTPRHGHIFEACGIKPPPRFLDITPAEPHSGRLPPRHYTCQRSKSTAPIPRCLYAPTHATSVCLPADLNCRSPVIGRSPTSRPSASRTPRGRRHTPEPPEPPRDAERRQTERPTKSPPRPPSR